MSGNGQNNGARHHPKVPAEIKPGFVIPFLEEEIEVFEERAQKFRIGDEDDDEFRMYRLHHGIYGQRQEDEQMVRIKLPYGGITADRRGGLLPVPAHARVRTGS